MLSSIGGKLKYLQHTEITFQAQKLKLAQAFLPRYWTAILSSWKKLLEEKWQIFMILKASMSFVLLKAEEKV